MDAVEWFARRESSKPEIDGDAVVWWDAFNALQGDRQAIGMGAALGEIPFTAIDSYARRYDIAGEDFDWLRRALASLMDRQLRHERTRREATTAKKKPQP